MSRKTEEEVGFVPVDELEKELGSVVQKLMNELRKAHSRLHIATVEMKEKKDSMQNTIAMLAEECESSERKLRMMLNRNTELVEELKSAEQRNALTEERLHAVTIEMREKEDRMQNRIMILGEQCECLMDELGSVCKRLQAVTVKKRKKEGRMQNEIIKLKAQCTWLNRRLRMIRERKKAFQFLSRTKDRELQGKEEVIKKKTSDMEALNKHISDSKIYTEQLQSRLVDISEQKAKDDLLHKETVERLQSRIEQMEARKTKDDFLHRKTFEGLQSQIQEMSAEKTKENVEHTDTVKKLQALVDEERKNRFELSYQYSQLIRETQAPENERKLGDLENKTQSLLLLRQDKEQQTELNQCIAELSDEKRPTKLAEEFSDLYDNEWTDAFEDVPNENEEQKVDFMLKLLMCANEICRNACTEHTNAIKRGFCTLGVETDPTTGDVCGEVPGRLASFDSKETRQATDNGHGRTNAAKQKKVIETDFEQTLSKEEKKTVMEIGKFFKQRLSEDVEKVGTEIILEEQNINQHQMSVVAYIQKCMNICWSMCRHLPPMHVDFADVTENILFDTNKYKPYTKSGKYVHYIVWPALYLHEGGPVLSKGVAQGRK